MLSIDFGGQTVSVDGSLLYGFDKNRLPKGHSYPLKRSALDTALASANLSQIHWVYYLLRQKGSTVLFADYCGESNKGWAAAGKSSITVYAVPSVERKETEVALLQQGIPRLCEWLQAFANSGNVKRATDHHLVILYKDGKVTLSEF